MFHRLQPRSSEQGAVALKKQLLATAIAAVFISGCGSTSSVPAQDTSAQTGINDDFSTGTETDATGDTDAGDANNGSDTGGVSDGTSGNGAENSNTDSENASDEANDNDSDEAVNADNDTDEAPIPGAAPPVGLLRTAQPTFVWPAVADAEQYKIVVKDAGGSGYARALDPMAANCQTGVGTCSASTNLAYYDNDLTWYVESTVNGAQGPVSESYSITTPLSENLQPIKSSDGGCEAWAAVAYGKYVVLNLSLIHI